MKKVLLVMLVTLVASGLVMSQFKVTSVGAGLKGALLLSPSSATDGQGSNGAGMSIGGGFGAKVRASMGNMPIRWAANVNYDIWQGGGAVGTITQNVLGIGLGAEYPLKEMKMGSKSLWPYVGGEIGINMFPAVTGFPSGVPANSGTRIGLNFLGGAEYELKEGMNLDVALKLGLANLVGKGSDKSSYLFPSSAGVYTDEGNWMDLGLRVGVNWALK